MIRSDNRHDDHTNSPKRRRLSGLTEVWLSFDEVLHGVRRLTG